MVFVCDNCIVREILRVVISDIFCVDRMVMRRYTRRYGMVIVEF